MSPNTNTHTPMLLLIFLHLYCLILLTSSVSESIECIPIEREALLRFKHHLIDPSNRLSSWNTSNPNCCHWDYVVCSNVTSHVLQLHLNTSEDEFLYNDNYFDYLGYERYMFSGEINDSLLELKHLNYLNLSGNDFGGMQIPTFLFAITSLTHLDLSDAGFEGKIPHQIGNLSNLLYLDLSSFSLTRKIPHGIGNLTNLLHLGLRGNFHDENIDWLSSLSSLEYLDLRDTNLSKSLDWLQTMQALPSLRELHLEYCILPSDYNQPSKLNFSSLHSLRISVVPKWIFQLNKLISLQLTTSNGVPAGPIPDGIKNLTLLKDLDLSWSSFSSHIPDWLYGLHHLKFLNLGHNQLSGTISNALGNLTSLISLDISDNQLEGEIPTSFRNLCNLRHISFSNLKCKQQLHEILDILIPCVSNELKSLVASSSQISGHLTNQLGMFKNLEKLDLSDNSIIGEIPQSLAKLSSLVCVDFSNNQLSGNLFKILRLFPMLSSIFIDNNLVEGIVQEDDLADFTALRVFSASGNNFTLKVHPSWKPKFQLICLLIGSWKLSPGFPSWIQSQKYLVYLDMSNVRISDSIPTWFWETTSSFRYLNFSHSHIHGKLPKLQSDIVDLSSNHLQGNLPLVGSHVHWLDLSKNSFSGPITDFLCEKDENPKWLIILNLASNNLSGHIPNCWRIWPELLDVNIESNYFIGSLPSSMGSLSNLLFLRIRNNKLSGKFPISLKGNKELISLDLAENNFTGNIPKWIGERLVNLVFLQLRSNKFSGNIPHEVCEMKFLQILDLAQNNLSGSIPKCLNHLSAFISNTSESPNFYESIVPWTTMISMVLWVKGKDSVYNSILGLVKSIDLSANQLSGEIPKEITNLSGLIFLNLSRNQLTGHIPQSIGNMGSLESIDFSGNQLSGEIPPSITKLNYLSKLDLSYNHLQGRIPTATQLQSFDASSFVGNNLCGPPLLLSCTVPDDANDNNVKKRKKHNGVNWFFVSMALGFIVGFWGFVGPLFIFKSWRYAYYRFLDDMGYKLQSWLCF